MILYEYKCDDCGETRQLRRRVKNRDDKVTCSCGTYMKRVVSISRVWSPTRNI